jgi:hypothetical protein
MIVARTPKAAGGSGTGRTTGGTGGGRTATSGTAAHGTRAARAVTSRTGAGVTRTVGMAARGTAAGAMRSAGTRSGAGGALKAAVTRSGNDAQPPTSIVNATSTVGAIHTRLARPTAPGPQSPELRLLDPQPSRALHLCRVGGDLVVKVPSGSRARESAFSLPGDRRIAVPSGDGPEIQLKVWGLFSDVKVTDH